MVGTQMPINMAAVVSPLKYIISEKMSERNAAMNNNLSVVENFLNITCSLDLKKLIKQFTGRLVRFTKYFFADALYT